MASAASSSATVTFWESASATDTVHFTQTASSTTNLTLEKYMGFTYTGYCFVGWTDPSGNTYQNGASYSFKADLTLYAWWTVCDQNGNGNGSNGKGDQGVHSGLYNGGKGVGGGNGDCVYSSSDFGTTADDNGMGDDCMFSVTYDGNGGGPVPVDPNSPYENKELAPVLGPPPSKPGCQFLGYSDGKTFYAWNGSTFTPSTVKVMGNIVLTAQWNCWTVTYDANGGTFNGGSTTYVDPTYYGPTKNSAPLSTPSLSNGYCKLLGWSGSSTATSPTYPVVNGTISGGPLTLSGSVTLYAVWKCNYSVVYNYNYGASPPSYTQTLPLGTSGTVYNLGDNPGPNWTAPAGCNFLGWSTSSTATTPNVTYAPGTTVTTDVTLYAVWDCVYNVVYNYNFGASPATYTQSIPVGQTGTVLNYSANPGPNWSTPLNCTFLGWSTSSSATTANPTYAPGATVSSPVTLYAIWNCFYNVVYNYNYGPTPPTYNQNVPAGNPGSILNYNANPGPNWTPPTNCTFLGWSTSSSATLADPAYAPGTTLSFSGTLYAVWACVYPVVYNYNYGASPPTFTVSTPVGKTTTIASYNDNPGPNWLAPSTCTFQGWSTNASASVGDPTYAVGQTVSSTVTLYAVWTNCKIYSVSYHDPIGKNDPSDPNKYANGDTPPVAGPNPDPNGSGCTFAGWSLSSTGSAPLYNLPGNFPSVSGNVDAYAVWVNCRNLSVTYHDPIGKNAPSDPNKYAAGDTPTVQGPNPDPNGSGCTFSGWSLNANGSGTLYAAGQQIPALSANADLYAVWTNCKRYTVTYHDPVGKNDPSDLNKYATGDTPAVAGPNPDPNGSGCTFAGWSLSSTGSAPLYNLPGNFPSVSGNVDAYAVWTNCKRYTVTYHDPVGKNDPSDPNKYATGDTPAVAGPNPDPNGSGCTFAGWSLNSNGSGTLYATGQLIPAVSGNSDLYAVWVNCKVNQVRYHDPIGKNDPSDPNKYANGDTPPVAGPNPDPNGSGCTFAGWSFSPSGSAPLYNLPGSLPALTGSVDVYAAWINCKVYTVTYHDPIGKNDPSDPNKYATGDTPTVAGPNPDPNNSGCTFSGWSLNANGSGTLYAASQTIPALSANADLYAVWTNCKRYTVTYHDPVGKNIPSDPNKYATGDTPTVAGPNPDPNNSGCTFSGWSLNANGTGTLYTSSQNIPGVSGNTDLYAVWVNCKRFTVTYHDPIGTSDPSDPNKYQTGDTPTVAGPNPDPNSSFCTFSGWSLNSNGTGTLYGASQTIPAITGNTDLYAVWVNCKTNTITYRDTIGKNDPTDPNKYVNGDTPPISGPNPDPNGSGCTFLGWSLNSDGSGTLYATGQNIPALTGNISLYAAWSCPNLKVTYHDNVGKNDPVDDSKYQRGDAPTVQGPNPDPNGSGCTFVGWSINSNGTGTVFTAGESIPAIFQNANLYAVWSNCKIYSVTYVDPKNPNNPPVDPKKYAAGDRPVMLNANATDAHCTLSGWSLNSDGSGTTYSLAQAIPAISGNTTVYAVWDCLYHVSYNANGGSGLVPADATGYAPNDTVNVAFSPLPTRKGYVFLGWDEQSTSTTPNYALGSTGTFAMPAKDTVLYAVWLAAFRVTYHPNGGTNVADPNIYNNGAQPVVQPAPDLHNCTFLGWSVNADLSGTLYQSTDLLPGLTGSVDLYADWSCQRPLTVIQQGTGSVSTSDGNIGTNGTDQQSQTYELGAKTTITAKPGPGMRAVWGGACKSPVNNSCTVTMSEARLVTVKFIPDVKLPIFFFDTDKWKVKLTDAAYNKLVQDLQLLSQAGITTLYADGYADVRSTVQHNIFLSKHRAASAAAYIQKVLKKYGLPAMTIVQRFHGQTKRFATAYTPNRTTHISY